MSAHPVLLFLCPGDYGRPKDPEDALRHSLAATRLLELALRGLSTEDEYLLRGDPELLVNLTTRVAMWTQAGLDLLTKAPAERGQDPAPPAPPAGPSGVVPMRRGKGEAS